MSQSEVQSLHDSLMTLSKQFREFSKTQDKMMYIVCGNELDKDDKGMIGDLKKVQDDVAELKEDRKKLKNIAAGVFLAGSVIFGIVQIIIKVYFK